MVNRNSPHVRSIAGDLVFTVLTLGLFNIYVQYVQIQALNDMLKQQKYSFFKWGLLTLITFGLYHIYHEYRVGRDLAILLGRPESFSPYLQVLLVCFALHIITDAIQQSEINQFFGVHSL